MILVRLYRCSVTENYDDSSGRASAGLSGRLYTDTCGPEEELILRSRWGRGGLTTTARVNSHEFPTPLIPARDCWQNLGCNGNQGLSRLVTHVTCRPRVRGPLGKRPGARTPRLRETTKNKTWGAGRERANTGRHENSKNPRARTLIRAASSLSDSRADTRRLVDKPREIPGGEWLQGHEAMIAALSSTIPQCIILAADIGELLAVEVRQCPFPAGGR